MTNDEEARSQDKYFSAGPNIFWDAELPCPIGKNGFLAEKYEYRNRSLQCMKPAPITGVVGSLFSLRGTLGKAKS